MSFYRLHFADKTVAYDGIIDLLNTLKDISGWDYSKEGYKVAGTLIPEENAMLFDLRNAEVLN